MLFLMTRCTYEQSVVREVEWPVDLLNWVKLVRALVRGDYSAMMRGLRKESLLPCSTHSGVSPNL